MRTLQILQNLNNAFSRNLKKRFRGIYYAKNFVSKLNVPPTFKEKAISYFEEVGDCDKEIIHKLEKQNITHITNKVLKRGTLYNSLRSKRPNVSLTNKNKTKLQKLINSNKKQCDFCEPKIYTTKDTFGRVEGKHCITASNLAKYDVFSGVLIFNKHNPLDFNKKEFQDYIETVQKWLDKCKKVRKDFQNSYIIWNCLQKAGASQIHGHMQMFLSDREYSDWKIELDSIRNYKKSYSRNYFSDWKKIYSTLNLGVANEKYSIFPMLTPLKEKEIWVVGKRAGSEFVKAVYSALRAYIDKLGVCSFNLFIRLPTGESGSYDDPCIAKIIDRGDIFNNVTDIGTMELFGEPIVTSDPFVYWDEIYEHVLNILQEGE